ncbi:hypothetical protein GCM10027300_29250 [Modestobacter lapidis]
MRAPQTGGHRALDAPADVPARGGRDQVDVLAEAQVRQEGAGECGAADEHQVVDEVRAGQGRQHMADGVVAEHLLVSDAELLSDVP